MEKELLRLLLDYIDKKIQYEFAITEEDEEGYTSSCVAERKEMELAEKILYNFWTTM